MIDHRYFVSVRITDFSPFLTNDIRDVHAGSHAGSHAHFAGQQNEIILHQHFYGGALTSRMVWVVRVACADLSGGIENCVENAIGDLIGGLVWMPLTDVLCCAHGCVLYPREHGWVLGVTFII